MKISVSSLGGAGEIGMNMYIYETDRYAVIVDCGVKFTKSDEIGVDLIIPDFSYIETIKHKKIMLIITHAHEDHIGAVPYLIKEYPDIAVVCGRYSWDIINKKLNEHDISVSQIYIDDFKPFEWGDFEITAYPVSHSIHGTYAVLLKIAEEFKAVHISDYKIDYSPVTCTPFPLKEFIELGKDSVDLLMADSTNIIKSGFTKGEHQVIKGIDEVFKQAFGRIFFTTFASNTERLQTVFNTAEKYGRKVALEGSSLIKHIDTAKKHGKLSFNDDILISRKQIEKLDDNKICFIATGSQGEGASVITKVAENDYSDIKVRKGDTFVFSSRIIPGNEHRIIYIMNNVYEKGGSVITTDDLPIHVSGHAAKEDALLLLNILKPKYLVPIHGEVQHLAKHKQLAVKYGMLDKKVIFFLAGNKIIFENGRFIEKQDITAGKRYVDLNTEEFLTPDELKNRKKLAINGAVVVVNSAENVENINENNIIIQLIGFSIEKEYINILKQSIIEYSQKETGGIHQKENFNEFTEQTVKRFFKKRFNKRPHINIINIHNGAL
ncbi:MAG: ribonuclease J [Mucispirillum sp.]|nr:ribonuclease J [Mucispirillum sp.]